MAHRGIELVSPAIVFGRMVVGLALFVVGLFYTPKTQDQELIRWFLLVGGLGLLIWGSLAVRHPMAAIRYHLNPRGVAIALIHEWNPPGSKLESDYEKSLHSFLKERLPFAKVVRQYGSGRIKCDLAIDNKVMIELKAGFNSTAKLQRLIGQIDLFKREWEKPLVVVLLGKTEDDLLHDLHKSIRQQDDVTVITREAKEVAESAESEGGAT